MKTLLKYLGAFLVLCGVALLAIHAFTAGDLNVLLVSALATEVVGILTFILVNKFID